MKRSAGLAGVLCVLSVLFEGAASGGTTIDLVVMTYNIGSAAGIPLGRSQMAQIARQIKEARADVVGMTEVDIGTDWHDGRDMVAEIAVELAKVGYPMFRYLSPTLSYHGGHMVEVLWSRYPILECDYRITHLEAKERWKCIRIQIEPAAGLRVNIFQTHYWIGDGSQHESQTKTIVEYAAGFPGPRILMGDFNFTPDSRYYKMYLSAGYREAARAVHGRPLPTVSGKAGEVAPERLHQIDFIWGGTGVAFLDCWVPKATVSDHWPIAASVRVGDAIAP